MSSREKGICFKLLPISLRLPHVFACYHKGVANGVWRLRPSGRHDHELMPEANQDKILKLAGDTGR